MNRQSQAPWSRRDLLSGAAFSLLAPAAPSQAPWWRRTLRWGQTNISEEDPLHYDIDWWRAHWRRTRLQGVIINAGGIVAYYPSRHPLHYRARFLGERDLYGELTRAAHQDGLAVLARMDSNRASEEFYRAHPDWFAHDAEGRSYRAGEHYIACIDGPYYEEYLPAILREIIAWEKPEGFTDNSWSGLERDQICYCRSSRERFRRETGHDLPRRKDWDDPIWRAWFDWSLKRRLEIWDLNNRTTRQAGGPDCLWVGMLSGDLIGQGRRLRDVKAILERSKIILLDDQGRSDATGFQRNAELGKRLHGLAGWDKLMPESMATYQRAPTFRKASAAVAEARQWMYAGFAGGIQPWWHHVGAWQPDRRQFETAIAVFEWHAANEAWLVGRRPVASVGVVYSDRNTDFYGRDEADERVARPYYGIIQALVRARIPYLVVHADHIDRDGEELAALVLPNLAAITTDQIEAVERYVARGGGLLATGETSLYNEWGQPRPDFGLARILGVRFTGRRHGSLGEAESWTGTDHTYLRLRPDAAGPAYGPRRAKPARDEPRHVVLAGFEATDVIAFGGLLLEVEPAAGTIVPLTFIPHFPAYPPEFSWMRTPHTSLAALVLQEASRVAYLAADIDRRFARDNLPDHGDLLANLIRWVARDRIPVEVRGPGLLDCHLYRQGDRLILHLVNLTTPGAWRAPAHEIVPVGPLGVRFRLPGGVRGVRAQLLVSQGETPVRREGEWAAVSLPSVGSHEVIVLEWDVGLSRGRRARCAIAASRARRNRQR